MVVTAAAAAAEEANVSVETDFQRGFGGGFGLKGISTNTKKGVKHYRAQTSVKRLYMTGRERRTLEAVVQDHMMLSQIRENLSAWFEKYGFNAMEKPGDGYRTAVEELQHASEVVLRDSGVDADDVGFCKFFCLVNAKAHIGRQLRSPTTHSPRVCLEYLQRLTAASHLGWCHLRSVYIDLFQPSDARTRFSQGTRYTQTTAATRLDSLYDRFAPRRNEIAQRREERRCRQAAVAVDTAERQAKIQRYRDVQKRRRDIAVAEALRRRRTK